MMETNKHTKHPRGWESVQFDLCEFLSKNPLLQQRFGGEPSSFLSTELKKKPSLCPLSLSQRFYYTVNRRSKIIHLKSDAYSSEMHLVFLNAQKSSLQIWFICCKKCDLNRCRQPGFFSFWPPSPKKKTAGLDRSRRKPPVMRMSRFLTRREERQREGAAAEGPAQGPLQPSATGEWQMVLHRGTSTKWRQAASLE